MKLEGEKRMNEMTIERKSNLVMPSHYVELDRDEMSYIDGGAWWTIVGWICNGIAMGLGIASAAVSMANGSEQVAGGLTIASTVFGFIGAILTGKKVGK